MQNSTKEKMDLKQAETAGQQTTRLLTFFLNSVEMILHKIKCNVHGHYNISTIKKSVNEQKIPYIQKQYLWTLICRIKNSFTWDVVKQPVSKLHRDHLVMLLFQPM